jgi:stearoyl-CoA 9-desaturase NADPH oxidoreductase
MESLMTTSQTLATALRSAPETLARRLFLDRKLAVWRGELGLDVRPGLVRARVLEVIDETPDTKTFVLRPGAGWKKHRAGQYTTVEVEIDGVRIRRCYSISSAPSDRRLAITVKRVAGGKVSTWLHAHVAAGDVLHLGPAAGDFVLPATTPTKLLLLSGGSGITPVMSIVRELAAQRAIRDVVFVHHARSRADVAFRAALGAITARHLGLRVIVHCDDDPTGPGRFDEAQLARVVPDWAARRTFLCGPAPMMARAEAMWTAAGVDDRLVRERFTAPRPTVEAGASPDLVQVRLARAGRTVTTGGAGTLLEQLERAGERPANGCRIGICQTCKCRKASGTVLNLVTGVVSSEPDQDIQLCISVPRSDLELSL